MKLIRTTFLKSTLVLTGIFLINMSVVCQDMPDYKNPKVDIENRVADLVSRMTLEEKCTQVRGTDIEFGQKALPANERLGIPPFLIMHGPYGGKFKRAPQMVVGTYFPVSIAMAATWGEDMVQEITKAMGAEMNAWGGHANAGPAKLKSGEKETVEFTLGDDACAFWSEAENKWTVEPGVFEILVGASSADIRMIEEIQIDSEKR